VTTLETALRQIDAALTSIHVSFALVGGLAVSVRTEPRFTRDVDLAVAVASDAEAEALIRALAVHNYRVGTTIEQTAVGRLATVRLVRAGEGQTPIVDLLFASSGIEFEIVTEAERVELLPGLTLAVARTGHLLALKVLARNDAKRPQDAADLRALLQIASDSDLELARRSLSLIAARGYNRGRPLLAEFDALLPFQP
jgi:predicted nucleotidyltransferase